MAVDGLEGHHSPAFLVMVLMVLRMHHQNRLSASGAIMLLHQHQPVLSRLAMMVPICLLVRSTVGQEMPCALAAAWRSFTGTGPLASISSSSLTAANFWL